jgi:organic radical activating enzyme|tara:strand:+ start:417 stop:1643 length:1227 start_codon:yes stop_codon:yes gene_type:complete
MLYSVAQDNLNLNLLQNFKETKSTILFGTGNLGKIALKAINNTNIEVIAIADNDEGKWGKQWNGYDVINPKDIKNYNQVDSIIIASLNFPYMRKQVLDVNKSINIYDFDFLLNEINLEECNTDWSADRCKEQLDLYTYSVNAQKKKGDLFLNSIDLVLTEKCSLKCKDCSNLMQYYAKPVDEDFDTLVNSIDKILSTVGHIREVRIIGGEPLLYKKIDLVINHLLKYDNYDKIYIYTNGTIVLKGDKMNVFNNPKVVFKISNYGEISRNVEKLENKLDELNIQYITERVRTWQDCAIIDKFDRDEELTKSIFGNCCENQGLTVLHGKLYLCPFAAHATNLDAIEKYDDDIIDTKDEKNLDFKKQLEDLYFNREYIGACHSCNGRDHNVAKVEAGVQTKEVLKYQKLGQ